MRARARSYPGVILPALLLMLALLSVPARPGARAGGAPPAVVPAPKQCERLSGTFRFDPARTGIRLTVRDTAALAAAVEEICSTAVGLYGSAPALGSERPVMIRAGVAGVDRGFDRLCRKEGIVPGERLGPEGYTLLAAPGRIIVAARHEPGLFYGLMTVNQLLRGAAADQGRLEAMRIADWPDLKVRGVMDDISRGPVPTAAFFRLQMRRLAEMKVNTVSYYTEHMVATRSHPEFAPPGAALTIDEWKELAVFARRYHIQLAGNFQSFGHFEKILAHPRYAHLAEGKSLLSPVFEESYTLLRDIYTEMVPAFNAPFFVSSCDETFDLGKGPSKRLVDSLGLGRVYAGHVLRLHAVLRELGVRMMIWGDVLLDHPEVIDLIPKDVVIGTWTYDSLADYHRYIRPFRSRGYDVLVTPGVLNSSSVLPNFRISQANAERFVRDGIRDSVLGAMTTVWDDGGTALFQRDWYGVAFAADRMWHCDTADGSFDNRYDRALYGDRTGGASRGVAELLRLAELTVADGLLERAIWSPVIPAPGATLRLNIRDWNRVLAVARGADSLLSAGRPLVHGGDLEALRVSAGLYEAGARLKLGVMEASRLYARAREQASGAPESLRKVQEILTALQQEFTSLKERYRAAWLTESKPYMLDSAVNTYDQTIAALADAGGRVRAAREGLEHSHPLPAPAEVRLAILESDGWYFGDWLVAGPITGGCQAGDLLAEMGGERDAAPSVTQEFPSGGATYRWKRLSVRTPEIDLQAEYPASAAGGTVYAYASLESPDARTVPALVGAGGRLSLLVNGEEVLARSDTLALDAHRAVLPLVKGRNRLLLKVCREEGKAWGFSFQLPGSDVRGRKNRYRIER